MITRLVNYPGFLKELAVKINMDLPYFWLSKENNLILCGKIDWLRYLPEEDAVEIIDFKTGRGAEEENSLQLSIYRLIAQKCQDKPVKKAYFWYLDRQNYPQEVSLPDEEEAIEKIIKIGKKIRLAGQMDRFLCPRGENGCPYCLPMEAIIHGQAELVGLDEFGQDVYFLEDEKDSAKMESRIL